MAMAMASTELHCEHLMFSTSDENARMKQIQATHAPDGRDVKVKPLLRIIEDIFHRAAAVISGNLCQLGQAQLDSFDAKAFQSVSLDLLDQISCEIRCKCSGGGDEHATTVSLFNLLKRYSWDAKLVLSLAAFAMDYGEFWVVAKHSTNSLAKSVAFLKQLPDTMEHADILKPKFNALTNIIKIMLDVTNCVVEFKDLRSQYANRDTPEILTASTAHVSTAVYWIIRSIVACASQIIGLKGMAHIESTVSTTTTEAWELTSLAHKVSNIHSRLMKQLDLCHKHIGNEKRQVEEYDTLLELFAMSHIDNIRILEALIYAKDDQLPLVNSETKRRVSIDVLKKKIVLLLISDLDLPFDELYFLIQKYKETRESIRRMQASSINDINHHCSTLYIQYEVVWLPVVDKSSTWNEMLQRKFECLQASMPWHSIHQPSLLNAASIKYIKEVWHFNKNPLLVALDAQGRVENTNAIHMNYIWGSLAFPFTRSREEALWKEEIWTIRLLMDQTELKILDWLQDGKHICLYGGEDIDWIRRFTTTARKVACAAKIPLEMLYVGKNNRKNRVCKINDLIIKENLSHTMADHTQICFFWKRLESMWHSKVQHGKTVENDPIMMEILRMLNFDGSDQGWAVIGDVPTEIAKAKGDTILTAFGEFELWTKNAKEKGFVPALIEHLSKLHTLHHCIRMTLPRTAATMPDKVACVECGRSMQKVTMYTCCDEDVC